MTETDDGKKLKPYVVIGSNSILTKYKIADKELTVHLTNGETIKGKIRWFDDYALKIILPENRGSITIPIHNILYYEQDKFLLENEKEDGKMSSKVFRGVPKSTNREKEQIAKYKKKNELIHFHLENGTEIKGKLNWCLDHIYSVRAENDNKDYELIKRHILYYRKLDPQKPERTHKGTIKMINSEKGFGFIIYDDGDLFFHHSEVEGKWEDVEPGQEVAFGIMKGKKGQVAVNIQIRG